jgi:phi13 family phage major tail protein
MSDVYAAENGLDMFHIAELLSDTKTAVIYDVPFALLGANAVDVAVEMDTVTLPGDNGSFIKSSVLKKVMVTADVAVLPETIKDKINGHKTVGGITTGNSEDKLLDLAFGFRLRKTNGKYMYVWVLKGSFDSIGIKANTAGEGSSIEKKQLKGEFLILAKNGDWYKKADEDNPDYVPSIGENWFVAVPVVGQDTSAPMCTVAPADGATAVTVTDNIVLTFAKEIMASTATTDNITVIKVGGAAVSGTISVDSAHKVVTFNPSGDLSAASDYIVTVGTGVKSLYGVKMASPAISKFKTA